jgi:bacillithiol system protein YtxJ
MGLFTRNTEKSTFPWEYITSTEQLTEVLATTEQQPVLLFKHSTRCSISSMALHGFERNWQAEGNLCGLYFIDLLKHREVSNLVAELTGIAHQSPQVIVIKGKEIVYDASHSSIDARRIESILRKG